MSSAYYRSLLAAKRKELANYEKRKSQLQVILSGYSAFDNNASDLNQSCRNTLRGIQNGIKVTSGSNNAGEMWRKNDSGSGDEHLYNSRSYINSELRRVENKISELNRAIRSLIATIAREEAREREKAQAQK